jgi:RNA polymerase sigma-70 factor (ECF subfamily)
MMFKLQERKKKAGTPHEASVEVLYDHYAPSLLALCRRYTNSVEDAEDILHDGFIKIIRSLPGFRQRPDGSFEGWMKRIMVNTALNHIRSRSKEKNLFTGDPDLVPGDVTEEHEPLPLEELAGAIDKAQVLDMICQLPTGYRTVFNMYVFDSYSHRDIAAILNCSENTSKSQLSKARAMLRRKLQEVMKLKSIER